MNSLEKIIFGRKGGKTTLKVISALLDKPCNINQIAKEINMDYNTAHYHVNILLEEKFVVKEDRKYGALYEASSDLLKYEEIIITLKKELIK